MVLRRIPGRNWGTKLSTFGLIMVAGVEELLVVNKQRILDFVRKEENQIFKFQNLKEIITSQPKQYNPK